MESEHFNKRSSCSVSYQVHVVIKFCNMPQFDIFTFCGLVSIAIMIFLLTYTDTVQTYLVQSSEAAKTRSYILGLLKNALVREMRSLFKKAYYKVFKKHF